MMTFKIYAQEPGQRVPFVMTCHDPFEAYQIIHEALAGGWTVNVDRLPLI